MCVRAQVRVCVEAGAVMFVQDCVWRTFCGICGCKANVYAHWFVIWICLCQG